MQIVEDEKYLKRIIGWNFEKYKEYLERIGGLANFNKKKILRNYWYNYHYDRDPDVKDEEMEKSASKSKYHHGVCYRRTFTLTLEE